MTNTGSKTINRQYPLLTYTLATLLFVGLLLGLRWLWYEVNGVPEHPPIEKGVIDLTDWDFEHTNSMLLDGEWEFYPGQLEGKPHGQPQYVRVPGSWETAMPGGGAYGYGTYRLTILIGEPLDQPYGLWFKRIEAASQIEVNGRIEPSFGRLAESKAQYVPTRKTFTVSYSAEEGTSAIELLVRAANFDNPLKGGIIDPPRFGSQASIDNDRWYSIGFQLVTFVILMLHGAYAIILYSFDRRQYAFPVFFLLVFTSALSIITTHDRLILVWLPINYSWAVKLASLSYASLTYFMLVLTRMFSQSKPDRRLFQIYSGLFGAYTLAVSVLPVNWVHQMQNLRLNLFFYLVPLLWFVILIVKMVIRNRHGAIYLLLAAIGVISSIGWGILNSNGITYSEYYPLDIIAAIVGFSAYWFKQYFRNAAENAQLNDQLKQADKLKDQFLAHTSHELRTPIHGIINIAQTVTSRERAKLEHRSYKDMELLLTIGRRMSHLVEDLLDIVRLKDRRIVLQERPLRLQSVAEGVTGMLSYLIENKPVKLAVRIPESFPAVMADEKRLTQILFNLVHNAIKYTNEGVIDIHAEIVQGRAVITVSDTGAGMDKATLERVFLPYEQGYADSSGIGLGLTICKQLIELHGGALTASSNPGEGTEFRFSLHLADENMAGIDLDRDTAMQPWEPFTEQSGTLLAQEEGGGWLELAPPATALQGVKQHILAIDDDPVNLKVLTGILSNDTCDITAVTSAREAMDILDKEQWDLVISDVMMPGMSGYDLTKAIRERYAISELPVLLLTARSQPADIYAGFSAGANDYLTKPVDALELKYRVWSLTTLKRSVTERLRMEAAYLQAQIHPHFLFNTLNSILALSHIDTDKMRKLADAFISYLRISFNFLNTGELVPLTHELQLVQSYLYIEKERFEEKLKIDWEVDPAIDLLLPPLTLQPLVENAVKHGALGRSGGGAVHIRIARMAGGTRFEVSDDGKGMTRQDADRLLQGGLGGSDGIGIANTNRRLLQRYRQGLTIVSEPDKGTIVSFAIPD